MSRDIREQIRWIIKQIHCLNKQCNTNLGSQGQDNKYKIITTTLTDLEVETFEDLTDTVVANWIASLNIDIAEDELYFFEVTNEILL